MPQKNGLKAQVLLWKDGLSELNFKKQAKQ